MLGKTVNLFNNAYIAEAPQIQNVFRELLFVIKENIEKINCYST